MTTHCFSCCPAGKWFRAAALVAGIFVGASEPAWAAWQLDWSDEFNGNSVNPTNWTFEIGNGVGGWGNNELEYYTSNPQNVYVTNGLLHIVAQAGAYDGFNYTSAKLESAGLFSQKYGRFEFYAKLPSGQGYWPAFWMMPEDEVYGGWAASGEIDVMENKGNDPTNVLGTIHFGGAYPNQTQSYGPAFIFPAGDSVTNFHLYAVEWMSNSISWYVDNQLYETQTSWWSSSNPTNTAIRNPYPAPFDQPFYIILNLAIGGNFGGNPNGTTVFPGDMQIDYVRAYTYVPTPPPPPVCRLHVPFTDAPGSTTTTSDTNECGVKVTLQMTDGSGNAVDDHGATGSGVNTAVTGARALDFSSNEKNQPGEPGPLAAVTSTNLGFGSLSNFVISFWFKQNAAMADGANVGPRLFVLGAGTPADTGVANSIGAKFQMANQLYFQLGTVTASVSFSQNLPTNAWIFLAAAYAGGILQVYQGSETNTTVLLTNLAVVPSLDLGTSASLYVGNRQDRQRSFDGWMQDFRFYAGSGDLTFVEGLRQAAVNPAVTAPLILSAPAGGNGLNLTWTNGALQSATNVGGPWTDVNGAASPYSVTPAGPQQFYRLKP